MKATTLALALLALARPALASAQEREDRTLLTQAQMTSIINEVSGERAMHHVEELVPWQRVRPPEEYSGPMHESQVMARLAKEYGFSNVSIVAVPSPGTTPQPTQGELWMTTPKNVKLFDIHDLALALASTNANGDISAELVDVGPGRAADFEGKDVTGKFVLSSGNTGAVYAQATQHGAIGVLAISAIGFQRSIDYPTQIVNSTVNAKPGTVAWSVTPAVQHNLAAMLLRGDKITIRSVTKSVDVPNKLEYVHAEIPGDGSTTQEVAISGHLYEGFIKQGANDDNSGCALTIEIGRAYLKLIAGSSRP